MKFSKMEKMPTRPSHPAELHLQDLSFFLIYIYIYKKKETLWVSGKYIKKNWRAAGLEPATSAPSRTIVTDVNC